MPAKAGVQYPRLSHWSACEPKAAAPGLLDHPLSRMVTGKNVRASVAAKRASAAKIVWQRRARLR
jgi:hypothetical protein